MSDNIDLEELTDSLHLFSISPLLILFFPLKIKKKETSTKQNFRQVSLAFAKKEQNEGNGTKENVQMHFCLNELNAYLAKKWGRKQQLPSAFRRNGKGTVFTGVCSHPGVGGGRVQHPAQWGHPHLRTEGVLPSQDRGRGYPI